MSKLKYHKGLPWLATLTPKMKEFEKETGKNAVYNGKITGQFEYWLYWRKIKPTKTTAKAPTKPKRKPKPKKKPSKTRVVEVKGKKITKTIVEQETDREQIYSKINKHIKQNEQYLLTYHMEKERLEHLKSRKDITKKERDEAWEQMFYWKEKINKCNIKIFELAKMGGFSMEYSKDPATGPKLYHIKGINPIFLYKK